MNQSVKIEYVQYKANTAITRAIKGAIQEAIKGRLKALSRTGTGIFRL